MVNGCEDTRILETPFIQSKPADGPKLAPFTFLMAQTMTLALAQVGGRRSFRADVEKFNP